MALVKKGLSQATIPSEKDLDAEFTRAASSRAKSTGNADQKRQRARTLARQQHAAERIAAASSELNVGVAEASAATEELSKAMQQISAGAEEAASASEESAAAMTQVNRRVKLQSEAALTSLDITRKLQVLLDQTNDGVAQLVSNVGQASSRQEASVELMQELENQAQGVIEAVNQVIRIADQTNLLALNAAIEAARAGKHGKGFAVVADTVRKLAEASEKNATNIDTLIRQIQNRARDISEGVGASATSAANEVEKGKQVTEQLAGIKFDMEEIMKGARALSANAEEMGTASAQALKGTEEVAAAAEEQSAGAEQARKAVEMQAQALSEAEKAASELDDLSEELRSSTDIAKSSEEVAAAAEELAATIEELNRASAEIVTAISQISETASTQAAAVEEGVAGITQIETNSRTAEQNATASLEKGQAISTLLEQNKDRIDEIITGINSAMETGRKSVAEIQELELISRQIDKIVDAIANVAIQTSMLAVNGAVEAARAGEYGKGFAVVSTDIQNLSEDAAQNAEQIKDMVKGIQDQILVVRTDLLETSEAAVAEVERAKGTTEQLVLVAKDMASVLDGNRSILSASQEIAVAVGTAKQGMEQIAAAAEQARTAADQASAAANQQSKGGEELAVAIDSIAAIADELQSV